MGDGLHFNGFNSATEAAEFLCGYIWGNDPEPGRANGWWVIFSGYGTAHENPDNPASITHLCGNSWWCPPENPSCCSCGQNRYLSTNYQCTDGRKIVKDSLGRRLAQCVCPVGQTCNVQCPKGKIVNAQGQCVARTNEGPPSCGLKKGNPLHIATGNKYQLETDYVGRGLFPLVMRRHYNSRMSATGPSDIGVRWMHSYQQALLIYTQTVQGEQELLEIIVARPNGRSHSWRYFGNDLRSKTDHSSKLTATGSGWQYRTSNGALETYTTNGRLESIVNPQGFIQTLHYDSGGHLERVSDEFGREIILHYELNGSGRLSGFSSPDGHLYQYRYDNVGNLLGVTYPDDIGTQISRTYHYEDANDTHHLTGITDENGNRFATWGYDNLGRAILSEHAGGTDRYTLAYQADGSTIVTDPLGRQRHYTFVDHNGTIKLDSVTGGACSTCGGEGQQYTYDNNGFLTSKTDFNGNITHYSYNSRGLQTSRTEAFGSAEERTITTQWHSTLPKPVRIDEPGKRTEFSYNVRGQLLTRTEADTTSGESRTTQYSYDADTGLLSSMDGPRQDAQDLTTYDYDTQGNLQSTTNALGQTTTHSTHDANGRPLRTIDPNGQVTLLAYDVRGRLVSRTLGEDSDALTTYFDYDAAGNLLRLTRPDGGYTDYGYDPAHRLIRINDRQGNRIEYTLDAIGNRIRVETKDPQDGLQQLQRSIYNDLNQLVQSVGAAGQITAYNHDLNGNTTGIVDARGHATTQAFDALNRLVSMLDPQGGETRYAYDSNGNLDTVTDPNGNSTTYSYDGLGNLRRLNSPDSGITTYDAYDGAGNLLQKTDANGITTIYAYDALNRLIQIRYPNSALNVQYYYDGGNYTSADQPPAEQAPVGRLTGMTDASGSTAWFYNSRGQRIQTSRHVTNDIALFTQYTYQPQTGLLDTLTYPSGRHISYLYDNQGQVSEIRTGNQTQILISNIQYRPFGGVEHYDYGNGLSLERHFDQDGRRNAQLVAGTDTLQDLTWAYDANSNVAQVTDLLHSDLDQSFGYDPLDRLIDAQTHISSYGALAFDYDANGNRTLLDDNSLLTNYVTATVSNRLASASGAQAQNFTYDSAGNVIAKTLDGDTYSYHFNALGRLSEIERNGGLVATYQYNGLGQRTGKTLADGTQRYFLYTPAGRLMSEADESGTVIREYLYFDDEPLALFSGTGAGQAPVDRVVDNSDPEVNYSDSWTHSTSVGGFEGVDYQYHAGSGLAAGANIIDNDSAGFSMAGAWGVSTSVSGYQGGDYRYHSANGLPPGGQVFDNNDGQAIGSWPVSTSIGGYTSTNYQYHSAGQGDNRFTWALATTGQYQVYARWTAHPNRATNATYRIHHAGGIAEVTVDQQQAGGQWNLLGTFTLDGNSQVVLSDQANGYVIADAIQIVPPDASPNTATWVLGETGEKTLYARWTAHPNRATNATYRIHHAGGVTEVTVNQQQAGGQWNLLGTFTLDGNSQVELTDQADGYVIADAIAVAPAGAGGSQATWSSLVSAAGRYQVYARWTAHPNRASNAIYTIEHADGVSHVAVDQRQAGGEWSLLGEFQLDGTSTIRLGSNADGYVIADALRIYSPGTTDPVFYYHNDHLGTPRLLTDSDQRIVWEGQYAPFGKAFISTGEVENNLRFPGQYFDSETGLHYNYFRDYDPGTGRYTTSDPIGLEGGLNTYTYALNNPLSHVDPFGLDVYLCRQPAFGISWNPIDHHWIRTDSVEAGMGPSNSSCGNAGNNSGDMPSDPVEVCDHSERDMTGASCDLVSNVDEDRVNDQLQLGRSLGRWWPWNQCQSFAADVLRNARTGCRQTRRGLRCN